MDESKDENDNCGFTFADILADSVCNSCMDESEDEDVEAALRVYNKAVGGHYNDVMEIKGPAGNTRSQSAQKQVLVASSSLFEKQIVAFKAQHTGLQKLNKFVAVLQLTENAERIPVITLPDDLNWSKLSITTRIKKILFKQKVKHNNNMDFYFKGVDFFKMEVEMKTNKVEMTREQFRFEIVKEAKKNDVVGFKKSDAIKECMLFAEVLDMYPHFKWIKPPIKAKMKL